MNQSRTRLLAARVIGGLVVVGAIFGLLTAIFIGLGYGRSGSGIYFLLLSACLFALLLLGIGTLLGQYWARLALSIVLPIPTGLYALYSALWGVLDSRHACDFSCYAYGLVRVAPPAVLCIVVAWLVYPGLRKPSDGD